jgi:plastocyanin
MPRRPHRRQASPGGSGAPPPGGERQIQIDAHNTAFDQAELEAVAGQPFTILFNNEDPLPHNVAIHKGSPTGEEVFQGEIVTGPTQVTYDVPALPAGPYAVRLHRAPQMTGTLNVAE